MSRRPPKLAKDTLPSEGTVYAVPLGDAGYGFARVLSTRTPTDPGLAPFEREYSAFVAVVRSIQREIPAIDDPSLRDFADENHDEISGIWVGSPPPAENKVIGILAVSDIERRKVGDAYSNWDWISGALFKLSGTSIQRKLSTSGGIVAFEDWLNFVDPQLVREVQQLARDAERQIQFIGADGLKQRKMAVIRGFVESINGLDAKQQFVDSIERDDLTAFLVEIGKFAGLDGPTVERNVEEWREW